ncbi:hypothetical protein Poly30_01900 [Planctomycetes bacterium Poly30]|uniref:Carboxypeptidase regulatory-like domain-containing protein n=1 Tax=Saltatorellus ferox TaxID=2528018 RepID=A0A518EKS1_9BACT|nr:hypothetical protein Poly30_01900 [Planctomycetes bacterium Poly30]
MLVTFLCFASLSLPRPAPIQEVGGAHGSLTAAAGEPLAGVQLQLFQAKHDWIDGTRWDRVSLVGSAAMTDAEGHFELEVPIDHDGRFYLAWPDGPAAAQVSGWLSAEELLDGIRLEGVARRSVTARLVDGEGNALARATVALRSTAASTMTDAGGVFTFEGVCAEAEILLVRTEDDRTTWTFLDSSKPDEQGPIEVRVTFELPARSGDSKLHGVDRGRAADLLESALDAAIEDGDPLKLRRQLEALAGADLHAAFRRLNAGLLDGASREDFPVYFNCSEMIYHDPRLKEGVSFDEYLRATLRKHSAPEDDALRAACAALEQPPSVWNVRGPLDLRSRPEAEQRREIQHQAEVAREMSSPLGRVGQLSRVALLAYDLGFEEEGQQIFAHARAEMDPTAKITNAQAIYAEALCCFDRDRGLEAIRSLDDGRKTVVALGALAQRIAHSEPALAESLLAKAAHGVGGESSSVLGGRWAPAIAYAMAPVDPERAERIATAHDRTGHALGMAALGLARAAASAETAQEKAAQKLRARGMIDRALDQIELRQEARGYLVEHHLPIGGSLLRAAMEVDPESAHEWTDRVLRYPLPLGNQRNEKSRRGRMSEALQQAEALLGWTVLDVCPELAEVLARSALRTSGCESGLSLQNTRSLWSLAATLDPERAADLARRDGGEALTYVGWALSRDVEERRALARPMVLWTPPLR